MKIGVGVSLLLPLILESPASLIRSVAPLAMVTGL